MQHLSHRYHFHTRGRADCDRNAISNRGSPYRPKHSMPDWPGHIESWRVYLQWICPTNHPEFLKSNLARDAGSDSPLCLHKKPAPAKAGFFEKFYTTPSGACPPGVFAFNPILIFFLSQTVYKIRRFLGVSGGLKNCAFVIFQDGQPVADILGVIVPHFGSYAQVGT